MPIKYQVSPCVNPSGTAGTEYACCRCTYERIYTAADIASMIEEETSYTKADIVGVISALGSKLVDHLRAGNHIDLKDGFTDLGIFSPTIKSRCYPQSVISGDTFDPLTYMEGMGVHLRPSNQLKADMKLRATLERVPSTLMP